MRLPLILFMTAAALSGCAAKGPAYQRTVSYWGNWSLDDEVRLRVSAVGMTQMRYELVHEATGRTLLVDYGRDTKGWFFVWDDQDRLWAHWADLGTVVWVPVGEGRYERHWLHRGSEELRDMPPEVSQRLPEFARASLGL